MWLHSPVLFPNYKYVRSVTLLFKGIQKQMVCTAGWRFGKCPGIPVFWARIPLCTCLMLFGHCPNFRLCSSPQSLCFTESQTFLLHFPSDLNMALQFKNSKERMSNTIPCRKLPSHSAAHTTDRRGTITVQHFVLLLWTLHLTFFCQILHFFHPHTFPLTCFLHQFVLLPLPARLKTRRRPWRRPKPTPLSLWPAWPTRSMP